MKRKEYDFYKVVDLILRRLLGTLEEKERREYEEISRETALSDVVEKIKHTLTLLPDRQAEKRRKRAYRRFYQYTHQRQRFTHYQWQAAAVGLLFLLIGGGIYWQKQSVSSIVASTQEIIPAQSKAYLFLADGSRVDLSGRPENIRLHVNHVVACDSGVLEYEQVAQVAEKEIVYNKICVPRGGEYRLVLSDGTGIWINADSELKYPVQFGSGEREVFVKGEAYFEVSRDTAHPFVVHTSKGSVKVLGTEFNVRDYEEEAEVVTTLVKGKVAYHNDGSQVVLQPGEQAVDRARKVWVKQVNLEEAVGWKDGKYIFFNETLENLMRYVERTYDVDVFFTKEEVKHLCFSGDLQRYDRVELFLRYLESAGDVAFEIHNKTITVYKK